MNWSLTPKSSIPACGMGWSHFFRKALHREPDQAVRQCRRNAVGPGGRSSRKSEQRKITTPTGEEVDLGVSLEQARLDTPILGPGSQQPVAAMRWNGPMSSRCRDFLQFPDHRYPHDAGSREPDPAGNHSLSLANCGDASRTSSRFAQRRLLTRRPLVRRASKASITALSASAIRRRRPTGTSDAACWE